MAGMASAAPKDITPQHDHIDPSYRKVFGSDEAEPEGKDKLSEVNHVSDKQL